MEKQNILKLPFLRGGALIGALLIMLSACNDRLTSNKHVWNNNSDQYKSAASHPMRGQYKLTASQLKIRDKLKATAKLLRKVVKQPKARKELRYAIDYYSGYENVDERAYLAKMFKAQADYKKALTSNKRNLAVNANISSNVTITNAFAESFRSIDQIKKNKKGYKSTKQSFRHSKHYTPSELINFIKKENIAIYFPYHHKWKGENFIPTLTYNPLDNEYVNQGWKPVINKNKINISSAGTSFLKSLKWKKVTVNDEYAMNHPTLIVEPCDEGPNTDPCYSGEHHFPPTASPQIEPCGLQSQCLPQGGGGPGGGNDDGDGGNPSPPPCVENEPCGHRIFLAQAMLNTQYDGIFAGGSVIHWKGVDAVRYVAGNDYDLKPVNVMVDFNRSEIRNGDWDTFYIQFDQDWEPFELAKPLYIYEPDGGLIDSINLSVSLDLGPIKITPSLKIDLSKNRAKILQTNYQRAQFFANNDEAFHHGLHDGLQKRVAGGLHWTFDITEYRY